MALARMTSVSAGVVLYSLFATGGLVHALMAVGQHVINELGSRVQTMTHRHERQKNAARRREDHTQAARLSWAEAENPV